MRNQPVSGREATHDSSGRRGDDFQADTAVEAATV